MLFNVLCLVVQSCLTLATPWTVTYQAPLSMGFSRQECWSGLPCPPPGYLSNPGIQPRAPTLQADSLPSEPPGKPIDCCCYYYCYYYYYPNLSRDTELHPSFPSCFIAPFVLKIRTVFPMETRKTWNFYRRMQFDSENQVVFSCTISEMKVLRPCPFSGVYADVVKGR